MRGIIVLSILCMLILSCTTTTEPDLLEFTYPITLGKSWQYVQTFEYSDFDPDTFSIDPPTDLHTAAIEVYRLDSVNTSNETILLREYQIENDSLINYCDYFCYHDSSGLYIYGNSNVGVGVIRPKITSSHLSIHDINFLGIPHDIADLAESYDPPMQSLQYPLRVGNQWRYTHNLSYIIEKKIVGTETIRTEAGEFHCFVIQYLHHWQSDSTWNEDVIHLDYICDQGLIKRTFSLDDNLYRDEYGNVVGSFDSYHEIALINTNPIQTRPDSTEDPFDGLLFGYWDWISSYGGYGGELLTPDSVGYTMLRYYGSSDIYGLWRSDSLVECEPYQVFWSNYYSQYMIARPFHEYDVPLRITRLDTDTLVLEHAVTDGYRMTFNRVE